MPVATASRSAAALAGSALLVLSAAPADAAVVTNYRDDFQGTGWAYFWNAPSDWDLDNQPATLDGTTGPITSLADYEPLVESSTANLLTATGAAGFPDTAPANFLRLTPFNGQPGLGRDQSSAAGNAADVNNTIERFAIAAYTVQEDGIYSIVNSTIDRNAGSAGTDDFVNVLVFTDPSDPVLAKQAFDAETDFDVVVGSLSAGDTIYVAVGADQFATGDFFLWNFDVAVVPEPGALGAATVGLGALAARRRR